jgi:hypothetical protein
MEDIFIPDQCESIAKQGDHVLLEYDVIYANGTVGSQIKRPSQLVHVMVETGVRFGAAAQWDTCM